MYRWSKEYFADVNQRHRMDAYSMGVVWAVLGAIGPFGLFVCNVILKVPDPLFVTYEGQSSDLGAPGGNEQELWDAHYESPADEGSMIAGFIIGGIAAIAFVALLYCLARFVADPIMYKLDMHFEKDSEKAAWLKRGIVAILILTYCVVVISLMMSSFAAEDKAEDGYVRLSDGEGTYYRVDKEDYEKHQNVTNQDTDVQEQEKTEEKTEQKPEEDGKTPVERGYPSNELDYYIDHPDEPMPEEMVHELMNQ